MIVEPSPSYLDALTCRAGEGDGSRACSRDNKAGRADTLKFAVEVFGLDRPIMSERLFGAGTDDPARFGGVCT